MHPAQAGSIVFTNLITANLNTAIPVQSQSHSVLKKSQQPYYPALSLDTAHYKAYIRTYRLNDELFHRPTEHMYASEYPFREQYVA